MYSKTGLFNSLILMTFYCQSLFFTNNSTTSMITHHAHNWNQPCVTLINSFNLLSSQIIKFPQVPSADKAHTCTLRSRQRATSQYCLLGFSHLCSLPLYTWVLRWALSPLPNPAHLPDSFSPLQLNSRATSRTFLRFYLLSLPTGWSTSALGFIPSLHGLKCNCHLIPLSSLPGCRLLWNRVGSGSCLGIPCTYTAHGTSYPQQMLAEYWVATLLLWFGQRPGEWGHLTQQ